MRRELGIGVALFVLCLGLWISNSDFLGPSNAINTLQSKGFVPNVLEQDTVDPSQDGRVIDQTPEGNSSAEEGSTVEITVGRFVNEPTDGAVD